VAGERDLRRDRELLRGLASGRPEVLAELYDRHAGSLLRHALMLTGQRQDAEDLVQAVFVKLATTGAELLGVRTPAGYLHRMVRTTWIDGQRRRATSARLVQQAARDAPAWLGPPAGIHEDAIDLARALETLPALLREAIVLHVVEGFSFREIGRLTGVSLFTAAGRYRTAIGRLRTVLEERGKPS
jgi:RNA polymerase sigma-70 factor (ECF subfamily)